eukprot:Rhum_TRINITY_DN14641_c20_g1::Rhum_TRINITY_DN14641_c20_g1_i1::g.103257::m.103257
MARTNQSKQKVEDRRLLVEAYLRCLVAPDGAYAQSPAVRRAVDARLHPDSPQTIVHVPPSSSSRSKRVYKVIGSGAGVAGARQPARNLSIKLPKARVSPTQAGCVYEISIEQDELGRLPTLKSLRHKYAQLLRFHTWLLSEGDRIPSRDEAQKLLTDNARRLKGARVYNSPPVVQQGGGGSSFLHPARHSVGAPGEAATLLPTCRCTPLFTCLLPHVANHYQTPSGYGISITPPESAAVVTASG